MLGRKDYTPDEIAAAKSAVAAALAEYLKLVTSGAVPSAAFEALYFNDMVIVLDRFFVHRTRPVSGKDGNPLNEVELIVHSLLANGGVFRGNKVIKYVPENAVLGLKDGDRIRLTAADFDKLSRAFFVELESKFA
jgi:hypothetical protein